MQRASEDPAHEAFGRAPERARWSWPHRVFVFALGLLLCFATFTLFVIEKVESYAPRCIPGTPPLARLPAGQLKALRGLGCELAQGFLLHRPLSTETVSALLRGRGAARPLRSVSAL